jgi:hypothetical protein
MSESESDSESDTGARAARLARRALAAPGSGPCSAVAASEGRVSRERKVTGRNENEDAPSGCFIG